jgi:hypothetical protein
MSNKKLKYKRVIKDWRDGRKRIKIHRYEDSINYVETRNHIDLTYDSSSLIDFYNYFYTPKGENLSYPSEFLLCVTAPYSHISKTKYEKGTLTEDEFVFFFDLMKSKTNKELKLRMLINLSGCLLQLPEIANMYIFITESIDIFNIKDMRYVRNIGWKRNEFLNNTVIALANLCDTEDYNTEIGETGIHFITHNCNRDTERGSEELFFSKLDYTKHEKSIDKYCHVLSSPASYAHYISPVLFTQNLHCDFYKIIMPAVLKLDNFYLTANFKTILEKFDLFHKEKLAVLKKKPDLCRAFLEANEVHPAFIEVMQKKGSQDVLKTLREKGMEVIEIEDISSVGISSFEQNFNFEYFHNKDLSRDILEKIFFEQGQRIPSWSSLFEELLKEYENKEINISDDIPVDILVTFICRKENSQSPSDDNGTLYTTTRRFDVIKEMIHEGKLMLSFAAISNIFDNLKKESLKNKLDKRLVGTILNTVRSKFISNMKNLEYNMKLAEEVDSNFSYEKASQILKPMQETISYVDDTIRFLRALHNKYCGTENKII